jgi:DNA-binding CsgD family transcriptional regulator
LFLEERRSLADATDPEASPAGDEMMARVAPLSAGQLDCLRLVNQHLSSKEIAAELNISPHTVDQRVRQALQTLGVERRAQAARIVAQYSYINRRTSTRHAAPLIPMRRLAFSFGTLTAQGRPGGVGFLTEQRPASFWPPLQPPFPTRSNPRNEMSVGQRLFWIAAIAIGSAFSAGMYLAGLESLARLLNS